MREVVGDALSHLSEYMDGSKTHKSEIASLIYLLRRDNAEILFQTKIYFYQTPKVDVIDKALCKRGFQYVLVRFHTTQHIHFNMAEYYLTPRLIHF